ncbi:MAG: hypothetical protein AAF674_05730 [Pseudomonadota bacterium]
MAVLEVEQSADGSWQQPLPVQSGSRSKIQCRENQCRAIQSSGTMATTMVAIFTRPLPDDVIPEEVTVAMLFRGSLALNFATGGAPDMTFSARCHRARRAARSRISRAGWRTVGAVIDVACVLLRGERRHCAVAWSNHLARRSIRR